MKSIDLAAVVLCPGWEMSFQGQSKGGFSYLKVYIADVYFAEMVHVCMAFVWIDAKSLRPCICMYYRSILYW